MPLSLVFDTAPPSDQSRVRVALGRVLAAGGDGAALAVAEQGRVRILDAHTLACRWEQPVGGPLHAVALSPDGARLAVGVGHAVRVWTAEGLQVEREVPGGATALRFGGGGRLVAGSAAAATWVETEQGWGAFTTHARQVLAVDRDGARVLSGGADAQVAWTDLDAGQAQLFQGHVGAVRAVRLVAGGRALSASEDGTVRLWAGPEGRCIWTARPPVGAAHALAVAGEDVLVGGDTGVLAVLDLGTGATRGVLLGHRRRAVAVGLVGEDGAWSVGQDRAARTWWRAEAAALPPLLGHQGGVRACALTATRAWTGGRDGTVRGWSRGAGREELRWALGRSAVQALLPLGDGGLVAGCGDGQLVCRGGDGAARWSRAPAHEGPVTCLGALPGGVLLSGGADGVLRAWESAAGAPLWAGAWHGDRLRCLAVGAQGRVATGGYDGAVRVGLPFTREVRTWHQHDAVVVGVAWCGDHLVAGGLDGTLCRVAPDGASLRTPAHADGVVGVRALDAHRVASIGRDGRLCVWRIDDLSRLESLDLGVPLDGLGGDGGALVVGDRRGGAHLLEFVS